MSLQLVLANDDDRMEEYVLHDHLKQRESSLSATQSHRQSPSNHPFARKRPECSDRCNVDQCHCCFHRHL